MGEAWETGRRGIRKMMETKERRKIRETRETGDGIRETEYEGETREKRERNG